MFDILIVIINWIMKTMMGTVVCETRQSTLDFYDPFVFAVYRYYFIALLTEVHQVFKKRALCAPPHHSLVVVTLPWRGWYLSSLTLLLLLMPLFSSPMYQILCSAVFIQQ